LLSGCRDGILRQAVTLADLWTELLRKQTAITPLSTLSNFGSLLYDFELLLSPYLLHDMRPHDVFIVVLTTMTWSCYSHELEALRLTLVFHLFSFTNR
jgi:hypothetical protein